MNQPTCTDVRFPEDRVIVVNVSDGDIDLDFTHVLQGRRRSGETQIWKEKKNTKSWNA